MDNLTKELTKIIFGSLGFIPPPNLGKTGVSTNEYLTNFEIPVKYDSGETDIYSVWAAQSKPYGDILSVAATAIINDDYCEFNAVYKLNNYSIHAIKSFYYDDNSVPSLFLYDKDNKWEELSTYQKLLSTAGFIKMADLGFAWEPMTDIDILYKKLIELVEL